MCDEKSPLPDVTAQQIAFLERLRARGFQFVAFPMYANYIGLKKGNCAALLVPVEGRHFKILGEPTYLVSGNLSARVTRDARQWFVWKKESLEASPGRLAELQQFAGELAELLLQIT